MVRDITDSIQFSPEQEIIIGKKALTPEQKMVENLDNARKNKKIKEIKNILMIKWKLKNLNPFTTYATQGLSYEEIAKLMNISNGRARQLRCRAIQELARQFKGMKIESFEEKILDYIDGMLSQKEEKEIREAIEKDQDIKNIFLDLKKGKELGEAAFLYDVTNRRQSCLNLKKLLKKVGFLNLKIHHLYQLQ